MEGLPGLLLEHVAPPGWSPPLTGRSALDRLTHVPYSFHFWMVDQTELLGMSRTLNIFICILYFSLKSFSKKIKNVDLD